MISTQSFQLTHRTLLIVCSAVVTVAFTLSPPQIAHPDKVTPGIHAPEGQKAFLAGHNKINILIGRNKS